MKKYTIYLVGFVGIALGILVGWLLFDKNSQQSVQETSASHSTSSETVIWTCSMHPQIRQNEPGDCPICGMELIQAGQANKAQENGFQMTETAMQLANIQTTVIGTSSQDKANMLKLNGKIQANETKSASLVTHIPGRIEQLYVSFTGEQVHKGQKIATIYSPELITAQRELLEAQNMVDISPGLLDAAKNKLRFWKISDSVIEDILTSGNIRETFTIHADFTGVVKKRRVSVGDYLKTGEVLFDIENLSNLWALFDVYEKDLPHVKVGSHIRFATTSAPNQTYQAKISFIDPVVDPTTRVAKIRAEVSNKRGVLKPEMFIIGELYTSTNAQTLRVPKSAVLWTGKRSVVYVKDANSDIPTFKFREIEISDATPTGYAVVSGLDPGEEVVTNGAFVIDASAQLNNQASMMNKHVMVKNSVQDDHLPDYTTMTPLPFKKQLTNLASTYMALKDALVQSDRATAATAATEMLHSAEKIDMSLLKDKAHLYWMEQFKAIQTHGKKIGNVQDIEEQRLQFEFLSDALIKSIRVFGVSTDTFYVQYCPMAHDNQGAAWLSKQDKIRNPYFGDKMLTCGIVQDSIGQNAAKQK